MRLMIQLTSDAVLQEAYTWLCRQRRDWPDRADVWDLRRLWPREKAHLQHDLRAGTYQFGLLSRVTLADGTVMDLWFGRDALVLKALTFVLGPVLHVSRCCTHLKGHGELNATVPGPRHSTAS